MAKQMGDNLTAEMFEVRRGRGRPSTGCAMTAAERQAAYRDRKKAEERQKARNTQDDVTSYMDLDMETLATYASSEYLDEELRRKAWLAMGKKMGWI